MSETPKIEVEMAFLTKAEGGRDQPPILATPTMYRPHLVVGDGEYLGVIFLAAPEFIEPQESFSATLGLVYHPNVDYSALTPGAEFTVREGARVVGRGRVTKR
jgi:translation elongation factor EF-Tu-like GTPase